MRGFSLSCDFFLLGGINFFGSLILLILFSLVPMGLWLGLWETANAVWQFLFLLFFLGLLFDIVPAFFETIRKKHPKLTVVFESFGWVPYVYIVAFTTLAGLDILGQFRMQFTTVGMWLTVIIPIVISLLILFGSYKAVSKQSAKKIVAAKSEVKVVAKPAKKRKTAKKKVAKKKVTKVAAKVVAEGAKVAKKAAPKKAAPKKTAAKKATPKKAAAKKATPKKTAAKKAVKKVAAKKKKATKTKSKKK